MSIKTIPLTNIEVLKEVILLQQRSYRVEAEIINFNHLPPLFDRVDDLIESNEHFLGYFDSDELIGVISFTWDEGCIDICRLAISPDHFQKGLGTSLLNYLERSYKSSCIKVCTAKDNLPAVNLYLKSGFTIVKEFMVEDCLTLVELNKLL